MPHTAEGHCWPCTAPRARGRPSSPPTAASGQTRAPPAKPSAPRQPVSVPVLPRNQVRVLLNHPCTAARWRSPRRQSPGTPQVLPPSSSPSPQQQEAPVGQETRARLLGGLGRGRRDEGPASGDHRTWGPSTRHGRPGAGAYELGPGGEPPPRRGRARPSLCVSGVGSGRGLSQHQSSPVGGGAALALTWHPGSAGTRGPGRPPATVWLGQAQLNPHSPGLGAGAGAGAGPGEDGCHPAQPAPEPGSPPRRQGPPERSGPGRVQGRHAASPSGLVVPGGGRTRRAQPGAPSRPLRTVLPPSRSALP